MQQYMFTQHKLKNGISIITSPQQDTQAITVFVGCGVGSRYETKELSGLSHFLEHMFFKGTKKRPNTLKISRDLDRFGANYNAFTGKDLTVYYVQIAAAQLAMALDILSDMMYDSLFDAKELEREKGVIVEEIKMYEDNPLMYIEDLLEQQVYRGNTLGWEIAGSPATVKGMTREQMVRFKEHYYRPSNMAIGLTGRLPAETMPLVKKYFERPWRYQKNPLKNYRHFSFKPQTKRIVAQFKNTKQVQMAIGFHGLPYNHSELESLNLLNIILGGNMSSRLFIAVRERRGLAYSVRVGTTNYQDTGNVIIQAGLDIGRLPEALKVIAAELKRVKEKGVSAKELRDAKEFLRGKIVLSLEDSANVAEWYVRQAVLTDQIRTPAERLAVYDRVKLEDITRVAKKIYCAADASLALIGPFKEPETYLKYLKF